MNNDYRELYNEEVERSDKRLAALFKEREKNFMLGIATTIGWTMLIVIWFLSVFK